MESIFRSKRECFYFLIATRTAGVFFRKNIPKSAFKENPPAQNIQENSSANGVEFSHTSLLRTINTKGSNNRNISCSDRDICSGFGSLSTIDVSDSQIRSLNLRFLNSEGSDWDSRYAGSNAQLMDRRIRGIT